MRLPRVADCQLLVLPCRLFPAGLFGYRLLVILPHRAATRFVAAAARLLPVTCVLAALRLRPVTYHTARLPRSGSLRLIAILVTLLRLHGWLRWLHGWFPGLRWFTGFCRLRCGLRLYADTTTHRIAVWLHHLHVTPVAAPLVLPCLLPVYLTHRALPLRSPHAVMPLPMVRLHRPVLPGYAFYLYTTGCPYVLLYVCLRFWVADSPHRPLGSTVAVLQFFAWFAYTRTAFLHVTFTTHHVTGCLYVLLLQVAVTFTGLRFIRSGSLPRWITLRLRVGFWFCPHIHYTHGSACYRFFCYAIQL